jgi:hypothetical protein
MFDDLERPFTNDRYTEPTWNKPLERLGTLDKPAPRLRYRCRISSYRVWEPAALFWKSELRKKRAVRALADLFDTHHHTFNPPPGNTRKSASLETRPNWARFSPIAFILAEDQDMHDHMKARAAEKDLAPTLYLGWLIEHAWKSSVGNTFVTENDEAYGTFSDLT